jgi:hypothetical protein
MNTAVRVKRRRAGKATERGSALLIVFVFAAIIAIMLYMELPVAVFEAHRQKEELLIDRGNEYAHAVKLFVRKVGTYPASLEALEKTNQMRFLRHRFKDPFTGKDDWRLLHAGPNGMLIDSKVNPIGLGQNGNGRNATGTQNGSTANGTFGSPSGGASSAFGSTGQNTFGSNGGFGSGGSSSDSTPPEVAVRPVPQRAPAVAANGGGQVAGAAGDASPMSPLLAPGQAEANSGTTPNAGASQNAATGQMDAASGAPGQNSPPAGSTPVAGNGGATSPQGTALAAGTSTMGAGTAMGTLTSPGIAGVASKAAGHSIKVVNDQTDYSLWEFYYDPTKDASRGIANAMGSVGAGAQQGTPQQNGIGQNSQQNGFGTSSPFGNSNSFGTSSPFSNAGGSSGNNAPGTNGAASPGISPQQPSPPQ